MGGGETAQAAAVAGTPRGIENTAGIRALPPGAIAVVAFAAGLALRYALRGHTTADTDMFILPWYAFAKAHGFAGLRDAFTNYTPFYSYLLIAAAHLDWLGKPLSLVKAISAVFEMGCAATVAGIVWHATRSTRRAAAAFAAVWLAPTVLFNGAMWGQADAIWTCFVLLSIAAFARGGNGALGFAAAVAVKAQAVFLGPFVLGMVLARRLKPLWLAAVPAVYFVAAVPVLIAGRPLASVLGVYTEQADYYHDLYKGAANPWLLGGAILPYGAGLALGLLLAAVGGLAIAFRIAQARRTDSASVLLAASVSLFAMPFLLPKMHDRFFYGFELAAIALAFVDPRHAAIAVVAQLDGVLSYLAFDFHVTLGVPVAVLCNTALGLALVAAFLGRVPERKPELLAWLRFAASVPALLGALGLVGAGWRGATVIYVAAACATVIAAAALLRGSRHVGVAPGPRIEPIPAG